MSINLVQSNHLINVDSGETLLAEKWQDKENQINYFRVELLTKVLEKLKLELPEHKLLYDALNRLASKVEEQESEPVAKKSAPRKR